MDRVQNRCRERITVLAMIDARETIWQAAKAHTMKRSTRELGSVMVRLRICLIFALIAVPSSGVLACPFCSAVSQTFSEEMKMMDVVALTKLKAVAKVSSISSDPQEEVPKSTFEITQVLKGDAYIKVGDSFDTVYFGEAKKDRAFLAMATDAPKLIWSSPLILSERAATYIGKLKGLPESHERLEFFQDYLEDEDEMLARDAYDEFAKAPYEDVINLKPKMNRERLLKFIQDPDVPSNRRRLYFTMLGVCGTEEDAKLLESFMASDDRKSKAGLDAMLACYVILTGEKGLDKVDELFLKNEKAEYSDTYAAIMAIRFHGAETDVVPRTRLVKSLRHMLDRPELADLVIPDLARWQDWDVLPKLTDLFIKADENSSWVRVPVINYLRACPLPIAKEKIEQLKLVDADSVKRAMTFFPLTVEKEEGEATDSPSSEASKDPEAVADEAGGEVTSNKTSQNAPHPKVEGIPSLGPDVQQPQPIRVSADTAVAQAPITVTDPKQARLMQPQTNTSITPPETISLVESSVDEGLNPWVLLSVTFLGGGLCFATMRSILGVRAGA